LSNTIVRSDKILSLCDAKPDPELGMGVYRLIGLLRMGIVIIDRLPDSPETMWLKMLGNRESAQSAFQSITFGRLRQRLNPLVTLDFIFAMGKLHQVEQFLPW
jgi:hypothetical protein